VCRIAISIPVHVPRDVHCGSHGDEAGDGADEESVSFDTQEDINERVKACEYRERSESKLAAMKDPLRVDSEEHDGGCTSDEVAEVEAKVFGQRKQEKVEDCLRDAYQSVLGGMDAFPGQDFEEEVSQENEAEEEGDVVQGAASGAVGVSEANAENGLWLLGSILLRGSEDAVSIGSLGGQAFNEET